MAHTSWSRWSRSSVVKWSMLGADRRGGHRGRDRRRLGPRPGRHPLHLGRRDPRRRLRLLRPRPGRLSSGWDQPAPGRPGPIRRRPAAPAGNAARTRRSRVLRWRARRRDPRRPGRQPGRHGRRPLHGCRRQRRQLPDHDRSSLRKRRGRGLYEAGLVEGGVTDSSSHEAVGPASRERHRDVDVGTGRLAWRPARQAGGQKPQIPGFGENCSSSMPAARPRPAAPPPPERAAPGRSRRGRPAEADVLGPVAHDASARGAQRERSRPDGPSRLVGHGYAPVARDPRDEPVAAPKTAACCSIGT